MAVPHASTGRLKTLPPDSLAGGLFKLCAWPFNPRWRQQAGCRDIKTLYVDLQPLATRLQEPRKNPAPYPHCGESYTAALVAAFPTLKRLCSGARVCRCPLFVLQSAMRAFHSFWSERSLVLLDPRTQAEGHLLETNSAGSITEVLNWIKTGKKKRWNSEDFQWERIVYCWNCGERRQKWVLVFLLHLTPQKLQPQCVIALS